MSRLTLYRGGATGGAGPVCCRGEGAVYRQIDFILHSAMMHVQIDFASHLEGVHLIGRVQSAAVGKVLFT